MKKLLISSPESVFKEFNEFNSSKKNKNQYSKCICQFLLEQIKKSK